MIEDKGVAVIRKILTIEKIILKIKKLIVFFASKERKISGNCYMYFGSKKVNKVWYNNVVINELVKQINKSLEHDCYMKQILM